jgi:hypothetical protein
LPSPWRRAEKLAQSKILFQSVETTPALRCATRGVTPALLIRARTDDGRKRAKAHGVKFRQEALQRLAEGAVQADLARSYGVSQATISS